MQKITVVKKEMKQTQKGTMMVALYDEKNTRFAGFLPELKDVIEGDTVEAEIEVDGKYNNIKAIKVLSHGMALNRPPAKSSYQQDSPEKRRSIERQTAAQIGFQFAPDNATTRQTLVIAEAIYQWIANDKYPPEPAKTSSATPSAPMPEASKAPEGSRGQGEGVEPPPATEGDQQTQGKMVIDENWLKESLESLQWTNAGKWLKDKYQVSGKRISEIVTNLTPEQQREFAKEVESRLLMA